MDGLNFPILSSDWFTPAIITLVGAVAAGVILKIAENKISAQNAFLFLTSTIVTAFIMVVIWYNFVGLIIFSIGEDVQMKEGCKEAFPLYKSAVNWNPKIPRARMALVGCGLDLNRSGEAIKTLEALESILSDNSVYWAQLSWAYSGTEDYEKMINSVEHSANLDSTDLGWISSLAERLMNQFKYEQAEAILRVVRVHNNSDSVAPFWLAWALYKQGKYEDAIHHFDECIRLNPSGDRLYRCLAGKGFALRDIGAYSEARILLETSLQLNQNQDDVITALEQLPK